MTQARKTTNTHKNMEAYDKNKTGIATINSIDVHLVQENHAFGVTIAEYLVPVCIDTTRDETKDLLFHVVCSNKDDDDVFWGNSLVISANCVDDDDDDDDFHICHNLQKHIEELVHYHHAIRMAFTERD